MQVVRTSQFILKAMLGCAVACAFPASVRAQQCGGWLDGAGAPGVMGTVTVSVTWDPDGAGSATPLVVMGGTFQVAGDVLASNLVAYDPVSRRWRSLGGGVAGGDVRALCVAPDGALIVGGRFTSAGGTSAARLARWDGTSWSSIGNSVSGSIETVIALPNGDLVVGGSFLNFGGQNFGGIARWNGSQWLSFGTGLNTAGTLSAMTLTSQGDLIIAGAFSSVNGVPATRVARFDGTVWRAMGLGFTGAPRTVLGLPDGTVLAGGGFTTNDAPATQYLARWNGTTWQSVDGGVTGPVERLRLRSDGKVVVTGSFGGAGGFPASGLALWTPGTWSLLQPGIQGNVNTVEILPNFDMIVAGDITEVAGGSPLSVARTNGPGWELLGDGFDKPVHSLLSLDGDDLLVGGEFRTMAQARASRVVRRRSGVWEPLGSGLSPLSIARCLRPEPQGAVLVGGNFTSAGSVLAKGLARFDGQFWTSLGTLTSLSSFDVFDAERYSNGDLLVVGGATSPHALLLSDGVWSRPTGNVPSGSINAAVILPNGDAVVGGVFSTGVSGGALAALARWDRTAWTTFQGGVNGLVDTITILPGNRLFVGGSFTTAGGVACRNAAIWTGTAWQPLGAGPDGEVLASAVAADGTLLVAGSFNTASGVVSPGLARWDGSAWSGFGTGLGAFNGATPIAPTVRAVTELSNGDIVVGGSFALAGGRVSPFLATWRPSRPPIITVSPMDTTACRGATVQLSAEAQGTPPLAYRWELAGNALQDGAGYERTNEPTLTISGQALRAAGAYRCIVSNACGSVATATAFVTYCDADFDCSGQTDGEDTIAFFGAWDLADPIADLNNDGGTDSDDLLLFSEHFDAGC